MHDFLLQAYPKRDITNIVESSHYVRVSGWCKPGKNKCKLSRWVKPYRCLGNENSPAMYAHRIHRIHAPSVEFLKVQTLHLASWLVLHKIWSFM